MAIYTATFSAVAVSAAQDFFSILAHSSTRVRVIDCRLNQYSDFGDAQAEIISVLVIRSYTVAGSGGSAVTPANLMGHAGALAAVSTVRANDTTVATTGTPITLVADGWNVAAGWSLRDTLRPATDRRAQQGEEIIVEAGQRLVFRITAPADALTCNGTLVFEEIGQGGAL